MGLIFVLVLVGAGELEASKNVSVLPVVSGVVTFKMGLKSLSA